MSMFGAKAKAKVAALLTTAADTVTTRIDRLSSNQFIVIWPDSDRQVDTDTFIYTRLDVRYIFITFHLVKK